MRPSLGRAFLSNRHNGRKSIAQTKFQWSHVLANVETNNNLETLSMSKQPAATSFGRSKRLPLFEERPLLGQRAAQCGYFRVIQLARQVGANHNTVVRVLRGEATAAPLKSRIAKALKVTLEELDVLTQKQKSRPAKAKQQLPIAA